MDAAGLDVERVEIGSGRKEDDRTRIDDDDDEGIGGFVSTHTRTLSLSISESLSFSGNVPLQGGEAAAKLGSGEEKDTWTAARPGDGNGIRFFGHWDGPDSGWQSYRATRQDVAQEKEGK